MASAMFSTRMNVARYAVTGHSSHGKKSGRGVRENLEDGRPERRSDHQQRPPQDILTRGGNFDRGLREVDRVR
jgi:hypothetical protein